MALFVARKGKKGRSKYPVKKFKVRVTGRDQAGNTNTKTMHIRGRNQEVAVRFAKEYMREAGYTPVKVEVKPSKHAFEGPE